MSEQLVLQGAGGTALALNTDPYWIRAQEFPGLAMDARWAEPADADGETLVSARHRNRTIALTIEVKASTAAGLRTALQALQREVARVNRVGGTLVRTDMSGSSLTYELLLAEQLDASLDIAYTAGNLSTVALRFVCRPFALGTELTDFSDDFSTDITSRWTFDTGSGQLSASGGELVPSINGTKRLFYSAAPYLLTDSWTTIKWRTGAATSGETAVSARRVDASNYLLARVNAGVLSVSKVVGGVVTALASVTLSPALAATTYYWLRLRVQGNVITAEHWTAAPTLTGTAAQSVTHTLSGSDATLLGAGISGRNGLRTAPSSTDWLYDDFLVEPNRYAGSSTSASVARASVTIPGDVPALGRIRFLDAATRDRPFLAYGARPADAAAAAFLIREFTGTADTTASGGSYQSITGLQTTAWISAALISSDGTTAPTHKGRYRVLLRCRAPTANAGTVSVRARYVTDSTLPRSLSTASETSVTLTSENAWFWADLGVVDAGKDGRWYGRLEATSTVAGDVVDLDTLALIPIDGGYGEAAISQTTGDTTLYAVDGFATPASGAVAGTTLDLGGTWSGSGDADDFTYNGSGSVARSALSDAGIASGRALIVPGSKVAQQATITDGYVQPFGFPAPSSGVNLAGVILRYVNATNFAIAVAGSDYGVPAAYLRFYEVVAGVATLKDQVFIGDRNTFAYMPLTATVDANGRWSATLTNHGVSLSGQSDVLATGGALASGAAGIYSVTTATSGSGHGAVLGGFSAFDFLTDYALPPDGTTDLAHDGATQTTSAGQLATLSRFEGDLPFLGPGATDVVTLASTVLPAAGGDTLKRVDTQILWTPRYLLVSE